MANGYLPSMEAANGDQVQLVASPAQFDEAPIGVERAPELGEHTEVVLNELGVGWDELASMKESRSSVVVSVPSTTCSTVSARIT